MSLETSATSRAALVTGAASGLAQGIVADLAARGYRVAFTYRPNGTPPDATLKLVRGRGADALALACDHALEDATLEAVRTAEGRLGRLDVLIHSVGPMLIRSFERSTLDDYRTMIDTNLRSAVEAAHAALPGMRTRGFGRLVFFGMNGSHATQPARGLTLYAGAKAAVVAFARSLALEEAGHGITVNVIEPGDIRDKTIERAAAEEVAARNPTGHAGSWEDVAYAVRMLIADEASFLNGVVLGVNGGLTTPHE